jgi:chorismate-pyruvate lyase
MGDNNCFDLHIANTFMTPAAELLYPLDEFYVEADSPLPHATAVDADGIPEPCRRILAHDRDMTPTLEEIFGEGIALGVLKYSLSDDVFSRTIVLSLESSRIPVVFGAIKIYLELLPPAARSLVVEMGQPLGAILRSQGIEHRSRPSGYFEVDCDELIATHLKLQEPGRLYGRRNALLDSKGQTLAQVLEILPPCNQIASVARG